MQQHIHKLCRASAHQIDREPENTMRTLAAVVATVALLSCARPGPPPPASDPATERAAVESAITVWFDSALAPLDTAAVRRGLADDFAILEDSVWFDRDGFVTFVAGLPTMFGGPFTTKYVLSDWRTTVEGDVAWTSLRNRALVTPQKGSPVRLDWRETVVLRKRAGRWLITRYQSAPVR